MDRSTQAGRWDAQQWPALETLQSTVLFFAVAVLAFVPRLAPVMLCLCAVLALVHAASAGLRSSTIAQHILQPLPMRLALVLLGYALLSVLWSSDRALALQSVAQAVVIALAAGVVAGYVPAQMAALSPTRCRRFTRALPIGGGVALAFILIEHATGNWLSLAVLGLFPSIMDSSAKDLVRVDGKVVGFVPFYLDRNIAALALVAPAVAVAAGAWLPGAVARQCAPYAAVAAGVAVLLSESEAAKLAAVCSAGAAYAVARNPRRTFRMLRLVLIVGIVLALPLGHLPSLLGFEHATWLPPSARERAMIWDRTATAVRSAPLLGIGVQSTRYQSAAAAAHIEGIGGARRELGWHAHNFVLQTWLELGAIGAMLLLATGLALLRSIERLQAAHLPGAVATFAAAAAIAVTGWGMWQPWLLAAMGTAVACCAVAQAAVSLEARRNGR